jgi:N utilization substance protein A
MVNKEEFFHALDLLEREGRIDPVILIESLEAGFASAYKRETGEVKPVKVNINRETRSMTSFAYRTVVEGEPEDYDTEISLNEAKEHDPTLQAGQILYEKLDTGEFSRIAAQTAKQVIMQRLNEAKKNMLMSEMSEREGELVNAIIRRVDSENVFVEMSGNQLEGILSGRDKIRNENYRVGDIIKVFVKNVKETFRGSQVIVSRSVAGFVKRLFENEVPELKAGIVYIKSIVREAGYRTKISVASDDPNVDAVGALVGPKGSRINAVVQELNGEKVDVIGYIEEPLEYIARALTPAKVIMVQINEAEKTARAIVEDAKLSLAIGKGGHNVKLAARLTGWKIDIKPYASLFEENKEGGEATTPADEGKFIDLDMLNIGEIAEAVESEPQD